MPPTTANKRALAPKEAALFKELLTFYESRQLKNGVKTAEKILKKHPEHGGNSHLARGTHRFTLMAIITRNDLHEGPTLDPSWKARGGCGTREERSTIRSHITHMLARLRSDPEGREGLRGNPQILWAGSEVRQGGSAIVFHCIRLI